MSQYAIKAEGLGKLYKLGAKRSSTGSLGHRILDRAAGMLRKQPVNEFWALRDATFEIGHGENVGFVGLNGAGKSTAFKILSRITAPTTGRARIDGRLGALLEVGTGFNGELSGRENVFLYGSILGMRRSEVLRKFDAILDFSGIEKFIDTPVKRYSSGMYVRLAFAVAAYLEPDILLLDEVLAVGDMAFQRKCLEHAKELQKRDATILFVSHNMFSIKTMCERVIYLKKGQIIFDGPTERGIELYEEDCRLSTLPGVAQKLEDLPIHMTGCNVSGMDDVPRKMFDFGERMKMQLTFQTNRPLGSLNVIVAFIRSDGVAVCNYASESDEMSLTGLNGTAVLELTTPPLKLTSELYSISVFVRDAKTHDMLCGQMGGTFHVRHPLFDTHYGVFHESAQWKLRAPGASRESPALAYERPELQSLPGGRSIARAAGGERDL